MKCKALHKHFAVVTLLVTFLLQQVPPLGAAPLTHPNLSTPNFLKSQAMELTVSGTVVDEEGMPIPGVSVLVKGTSIGVATDLDGKYTVDVPSSESILVFSYLGYEAQEVTVGNQSTIDITLGENLSDLGEVVVVGYGVQKKGTITGAVGEVDSKDLIKTPSVTTSEALVGKIQGVTARQTDARPGSSASIQIRNMGTPLYVIDGIPSDAAQFNNLGQNDIESISVLKDASAAIYGMRAANGVVLVTTKKGKANQPAEISLSGYYGLQNFTRYPEPANAYQYLRANAESNVNAGRAPGISPDELSKWQQGTEKGYVSTDYYDFVIKPNVPQYSLNGSAVGGSENTKYYISLGHLKQDATIEDYLFERTNFQSNIDVTLADGFKVGMQLSGRIENREQVGVPGLDDYFNPFLSIFTMWPTERPYANDNPNYVNGEVHNINVNPATYTKDITGYVNEVQRAIKGNFFAQYDFDFGLSMKGTYSYNYTNLDFDGFEYTYDGYGYDEATDTYFTNDNMGNQNPWRERRKRNTVDRVGQFQVNYAKNFGAHNLSAILGYERWDQQSHYMIVHTVPPNNYIPLMSFADQDVLIDEIYQEARDGYLGKINYDYKEKYLVEFIARYDGSFLFPKEDRYGFFPGVSAGWKITDEPFMDNVKGNVLSDMKIRASWGQTGNDRWIGSDEFIVAPFSYYAGYDFIPSAGGSAVLDGGFVPGVDPRGLPVTNLSWVTNTNVDIGIDTYLFNSKLFLQADVFQRKRTGIPASRYDVLLPVEVGYTLPVENLESDVHRGVEGMVTYTGRTGEVDFSLSANATISRLKTLERYKPRFGNSWNQYRDMDDGRWNNINWGYNVVGRFESEEQIENYPVDIDGNGNRNVLPGDFIYEDVNGDGLINNLDERPIGYAEGANPYVSFGLNGSASYKGFELYFSFAGASMQTFTRNWELRYPFQNNGNSPDFMFEDRWHREDLFNADSEWVPGTYPAIRRAGADHLYRHSNFWLTNVRYLRLRNLELGYRVPKAFLEKYGIGSLRVYANGTNLVSFDNVKSFGIDPEIGSANGLVYPQQRLFNFGFNLTF
ncbi:SusC/RagA family TonB-linked outer membrane protein [Echinicola strongylocentroti]|uniref:SusC/RagA family TonB-linked outer membrane protein n=1 Tax=Echinicola strongylocentroti TaxID=1795355 RepID=A0A2Z4II59_9BACT|nr:TonB-dependent receptor [Echinicola strongylocentroti]AWW30246.1 SusC/RagA family TonB-linked outer membrane protein [Echinicola strongylocentroti]